VSGPPEIVLFLGRLHPLLVHLPIGLILLLALLELASRWPRFARAHDSVGFILTLAVPLSLGTALCGWLLSLGGGYENSLLRWHQWTGIGTAAACALAGLLYRLEARRVYRVCLFATTGGLVAASHFGGSLTHGRDYLTRYAPAPLRALLGGPAKTQAPQAKKTDAAALPVFSGIIKPFLDKDCVECHGPEKAKGGLRMDSLPGLIKGGKSGLALVPGKTAESELLRRLRLPSPDEDHMPPEGKAQPTADEIALIEWWIGAGAPGETNLGALKPPARILQALAARTGTPPPPIKLLAPKPLETLLPSLAQLSDQLHIVVGPLSQRELWLQCNASVAGTNSATQTWRNSHRWPPTSAGWTSQARGSPMPPSPRWASLPT
jgi:uncharacterized membrane protein